MFSIIKGKFSILDVVEENNIITIEGLDLFSFRKDVERLWNTSTIIENMFIYRSSYKIRINRFFAPDFVYICNRLMGERRNRIRPAIYQKVIDGFYVNTWMRSIKEQHADILDFSQLSQLKVSLFDHQMDFLKMYNNVVPRFNLNGYMLAAPPGTGKTLMNIAISLCLKADAVIIIAPNNSVYKVWDATISNMIYGAPKAWVSQDKVPFPKDCRYFIFHFEAVNQAVALVKERHFHNPVIILDESHNFNEITSLRTNLFIELCQEAKCKNVIWASGTPIKALGAEAIPFLSTVDPFFRGRVPEIFKSVFGMNRTRAIDILANRLGIMSFKVEKRTVVTGEPVVGNLMIATPDAESYTLEAIREDMRAFIVERVKYYKTHFKEFEAIYAEALAFYEKTISTRTDMDAFKLYKRYISEIRRGYDPVLMKDQAAYCNRFELTAIAPVLPQPLKNDFKNARSVIKYVELKIQGECLGRILGSKRIECYRSLVQHTPLRAIVKSSEKKTVIFSSYVDVVDDVVSELRKDKLNPLVVYGATNHSVSAIVTRFETDPEANPMVATFPSLSTAVPLIVANTIVMMNTPFRDYEFQQAVARCHRIGQDTQVFVIMVLLDTGDKPNISTRSKDIMEWSLSQVEQLLGVKGLDKEIGLGMEAFDTSVSCYFNEEGLRRTNNGVLDLQKPRSLTW